MPLNVQLELYNKAWELMEGYAPFDAVFPKAGQKIKTTSRGATREDMTRQSPAEFPKIRIDVGIERSNVRPPRTFGQNSTTYTAAVCDYRVPMTVNLEIKVVYDEDQTLKEQSEAEAAIRGALLKFPNLGLAWVNPPVEIQGTTRREENNADTGNRLRTVARTRVVINARPLLSELTNDTNE